MKTYFDFYEHLKKTSGATTDDLLREQGIDVLGSDSRHVSTSALLVLYAMRLRELEERVSELEKLKGK